MAWYPLNGDLKDYSGNYPDWENNNLVEYESGKIGKTYHFSSTEYGQLSTTGFVPEKDKEFSCAFWVKELSDYSQYGFRVVYQCGEFIIGQYQNHFNGYFTSGGCDIEGATVDFTKWNHCALTFTKDGLVTLYVNGKKHLSKQATAFPKAGSTYLGRRTTGGNNTYVDMYVNDLRIYDHCLSDTEIKKISQGLIVHYSMSNPDWDNNLLRGTAEWKYWLDKADVDINGSVLTMNSSVSYPKYEPVEVTVEKQYVVSVDTKADENFTATDGIIIFDYLDSSKNRVLYYWGAGNYTTKWERKNWIITVPSDDRIKYISLGVRARDGKKVYYKKLKLESGDIPHPWCDNSTFSYEPDKVYDTTGFGNNGIITNLNYSNYNKIGNTSVIFNGNTSKIVTETGSFKWFQFDECTIAAWMKPYNTPNTYAGGIGVSFDGGNLNGNNGRTFSINNHSGIFCVDGIKDEAWVTYSSGYTLPLNEWTFCVATLDKEGYIHFYVNGKETKKVLCNWGATTYTNNGTLFQVGVDLVRWR